MAALWNTQSLWLEVSITTVFLLLGHIFLGHFEERSPKLRKVLKAAATVAVVVLLSIFFGRSVAFWVLGLSLIPIIWVHGVLLPRKGINGWTGEPKARYYEFRGWSKDIFGESKPDPGEKVKTSFTKTGGRKNRKK